MGDKEAGMKFKSAAELAEARERVWEEYAERAKSDPQRKEEFETKTMVFGDAVMRYEMYVIGEKPEGGYPLYIALHGGGGAPKALNDSQWEHMKVYYRRSVGCGVYVAPRGVRDTWNTHFNDASYPLYDRLIENMILFAGVDPNRVYLLGFSAGGDGVYAITPRMADRFAAANMSAGHPNGVSLKNLYSLPLAIQVGERDTAYGRNTEAAVYDGLLGSLAAAEGGYVHRTFIHYEKPHNFYDNHPEREPQKVIADVRAWKENGDRSTIFANTNAVDWVTAFERKPYPEKIIWDLGTRAPMRRVRSFYWLRADSPEPAGEVKAQLDRANNSVMVETKDLRGGLTVLLNEDMLDIFAPVKIEIDGEKLEVYDQPSMKLLYHTTLERGDRFFQFAAGVKLCRGEDGSWKAEQAV